MKVNYFLVNFLVVKLKLLGGWMNMFVMKENRGYANLRSQKLPQTLLNQVQLFLVLILSLAASLQE